MNNFCEECGNKLTPDDLFCEQCGAKIPQSKPADEVPSTPTSENKEDCTFSFFENRSTKATPEPGAYYGIILTNFQKIGATAGKAASTELKQNLLKYINELKKIGINYLVLDAGNNHFKNLSKPNWKRHVNLLRKATNKISKQFNADTRFLLILGGHEIIPMPVFENPTAAKSSDKDVDSDLPYSTLSVGNPLEDATAREPLLPVGRIPTGNKVDINYISATVLRAP
ncbi:MAG: zinc ribbon domain-containing protein [Salinivirgaceae bacterium]